MGSWGNRREYVVLEPLTLTVDDRQDSGAFNLKGPGSRCRRQLCHSWGRLARPRNTAEKTLCFRRIHRERMLDAETITPACMRVTHAGDSRKTR